MYKSHFLSTIVLLSALLSLHSTVYVYAAAGKLPVFVSIAPQAFLVKKIGGEHVAVQTLIPPGQEPHIFAPTPKQIMMLGNARIFFKIGMNFEEALVTKIAGSHQSVQFVDMTTGVDFRMMAGSHAHGHEHDHDEHEYTKDPHVWLGGNQLAKMAVNVKDALVAADPDNQDYYQTQLQSFLINNK